MLLDHPSTRSRMSLEQPRRDLVLLVEDEESFVEALRVGLQREGYRVVVARDGQQALSQFAAIQPDLILLDLMLPKVSGLDVCRTIRSESRVPIIMLTAKASEIDIIVGLEVGADDYIVKPYRLRELVARMRAVSRRSGDSAALTSPDLMVVGELSLDRERHRVELRGTPIELPLREFELLRVLMERAGRVVPREVLLDNVWGLDFVGSSKTLDVHVKRLRKKIEDDPKNHKRITTIRGLGYRLEDSK